MEQNNYKGIDDFKQIWQELYKVDFSQEMSHDEEVKALILQKLARSCFDTLRSFPVAHMEQNTNAKATEDMQIVLKVLEAVKHEWEDDFSEMIEYGTKNPRAEAEHSIVMAELDREMTMLNEQLEMLHQNQDVMNRSEKTMNHEELRRLYDDASYLGVSAPAWSGHEYAVEYEPAREVLSHLEQYERQLGNIGQANDIKELLNPSVGFSPNDVKHLEATEKRYWELFDKSFARLESSLFHPQQEFTPDVKMSFIDNNGTLAYAYAHFKLTIDNPEIRNDLISRLNIKTDKTDSVEFYLQVADEEESIMQAKINNSVFTIPLTEAEKSEYAFNANLFMEREYNCTIENYIDSGDRYYGEFGEYPKSKMEKNHKDYEVTTTVTGHLEIGKETVPDMSSGYDEAIEQLLGNANLGAMNSAEIIGKNFDEHEMLLNIQGKFTVSVEALNESQAIRLAEQTFQRADFQDLQNVTHEEWTVAEPSADKFLAQSLDQIYISGENDSAIYGYLADFKPEVLKTIAEIAECDVDNIRAAYIEVGAYTSGSPTSLDVILVDKNAQCHVVNGDKISEKLDGFKDTLLADSDYSDTLFFNMIGYVESRLDYAPAELALMNEFAHLYNNYAKYTGGIADTKDALGYLQNNEVFLGEGNVDTEKLVELIDNINGQMQPMAADDKSNFTKEGITMAQWGKNSEQTQEGKNLTENLQAKAEAQQAQDVQATSQGKGWWQKNASPEQKPEKKEPAMAQIAKSTSEAMKDNPDMRNLAFELMKTAKEMGAKAKEQGLTTTGRHKNKQGETYETVNKFYVKVEPVTSKDEKTGQEQTNLLGSITHTIGNTTLAVHTKKDSAELSSITAVKFNSQHQKEAYAKGNDEIQANPAFNKYAKNVAQMIQDEGFVKAQEQTREKPIMLQFAQYAQAEIFKNGAQVMKEDGTTVADCYSRYRHDDQYGDKTELRSHSAKDIVVELSYRQDEQYGQQPVAKAINFGMEKDENGRFPSLFINKAEDLNRPEFQTLPTEIKSAISDFKGFDQREQQKTTEQKEAPKKSKGGEER